MRERRSHAARARAGLAWGLVFLVGSQLGLTIVADRWRPEWKDPEYGQRRRVLQQRLAEYPDRPLVLALGSSRTELGFRPDSLPTSPLPDGRLPMGFNLGLAGAGPLMELICLRRVLADRVRPALVLVEVLPSVLPREAAEPGLARPDRLIWLDVPVVRRYCSGAAFGEMAQAHLLPGYVHRFCLLSRYAPGWLPWENRMDLQWTQMDRWGWLALTHGVPTAEEYQRSLELTHTQHQPALQQFHISDSCNRAMRELLDLCRREHIPAVLVLMPEATAFRSWYPLRTRVQLHTWLGELSEAYGVPLVDASDWLADAYFGDGHHLHPQGAARFTERLGREVIQPFLRK